MEDCVIIATPNPQSSALAAASNIIVPTVHKPDPHNYYSIHTRCLKPMSPLHTAITKHNGRTNILDVPGIPLQDLAPANSNLRNTTSRRHPRTPTPPSSYRPKGNFNESISPQCDEPTSNHAELKTTSSDSFGAPWPSASVKTPTPPLDLSKVEHLPKLPLNEVASTAIHAAYDSKHVPLCIRAFKQPHHTTRAVSIHPQTRIYIKKASREHNG